VDLACFAEPVDDVGGHPARTTVRDEERRCSDPTAVVFKRIDTASQPTRFISAVAIDPENSNHAFVSFSGYNAYTPTTPGHVFDVRYHPGSGTATWTDHQFSIWATCR